MKKTWSFFRTKIFYVALAVGLVAFASLVAVYNYRDAKEELNQGQAIDLNQPVDNNLNLDTAVGQNDELDYSKEPVTQIGKISESTTEAKSTEETTEEVTEDVAAEENEDDTAPVSSNSASAAPQLNYNGEQELAWPLIGDVILPFSMETTVYYQTLNAYKCNPGMLIRGNEGANVLSVYEGVVADIYETKEHGTVVEIDLGNGYRATYGQLMNVCVNVGDKVSMEQNIAELGPVSSYYTEEGTHLYFQITKDTEPVNPLTLIK
ncbi:MAG: M23 family metallopeptidase [Lachnospiraceae bacterium]|nr:M23 family metallopeptidase [Lachnospiraceae bacterium]